MKKLYLLFLPAILFIACNNNQEELGKDITIPVSIEEIKPASIEKYVEITGSVKPLKEVVLKAEMAGRYNLKLNPQTGKKYALGDRVTAGVEIIELKDEEYVNGIQLNSQKLNLEITEQVYKKQESLYEKGGVTLSDLKNAEISYIQAKYSYEDALIKLDKMHIKAPFTGVIIDLPYFTPDVRIDASSSLVKIMDYNELIMEINLPEKTMGEIKPGQNVRITNYSLPNDTIIGKVTEVSPAIETDTRSYKGQILVENAKMMLRPGMYVKGEIVVASEDNTIVIPKDIVVSKQRGNSVFVVDKGIARERVVEFGLENPNEVQIISGINMGEKIVVKGFETLRDQSKVKEIK